MIESLFLSGKKASEREQIESEKKLSKMLVAVLLFNWLLGGSFCSCVNLVLFKVISGSDYFSIIIVRHSLPN